MNSYTESNLLEASSLDAVAPISDDFDLSSLQGLAGDIESRDDGSLVDPELLRSTLFYDELVTVCIILQCPLVEEDEFKRLLEGAELRLETHAIGVRQQEQSRELDENGREKSVQHVQSKDLVDSRIVPQTDDPVVALSEHTDGGQRLLVLWKAQVHIARSRIRSQRAAVAFLASITYRGTVREESSDSEEPKSPSELASPNLFAAMQSDPDYADEPHPPILTASRLAKSKPASPRRSSSQTQSLTSVRRRPTRLVPAITMGVGFRFIGQSPNQARVYGSVEVEVGSRKDLGSGTAVLVRSVQVKIEDGEARAVSKDSFPRHCQPGDKASFVYSLEPARGFRWPNSGSARHLHSLSVNLSAAHVSTKGLSIEDSLKRPITSVLRASVDLSSLKQSHLPARSPATPHISSPAPSHIEMTSPARAPSLFPLSVTIDGPATYHSSKSNPTQRTTVTISVLLVNHSTIRTLSLALIPIPSHDWHPKHTARARQIPNAIPSWLYSAAPVIKKLSESSEVKSTPSNLVQLIPKTPDVRVGPIEPGSSQTALISLQPLMSGVLQLAALRIVDVESGHREGDGQGRWDWSDIPGSALPDIVLLG